MSASGSRCNLPSGHQKLNPLAVHIRTRQEQSRSKLLPGASPELHSVIQARRSFVLHFRMASVFITGASGFMGRACRRNWWRAGTASADWCGADRRSMWHSGAGA